MSRGQERRHRQRTVSDVKRDKVRDVLALRNAKDLAQKCERLIEKLGSEPHVLADVEPGTERVAERIARALTPA